MRPFVVVVFEQNVQQERLQRPSAFTEVMLIVYCGKCSLSIFPVTSRQLPCGKRIKMIDELQKLTREACWADASEMLYKHWISVSQSIFPANVPKPWEAVADEAKIESDVLYPLAAMFCVDGSSRPADDGRPDISLRRLRELVDIDDSKARSGQICGKIFKNGEPNYTCKQCATDSTCVLCYECFINSGHVNHKYKMHTSMGGGYCDCGDKEAWSTHYACRLHSVNAPSPEEGVEDELARAGLPPRIATRFHRLSLIALKFAVNVLCWDRADQFPSTIDERHLPTAQETTFQTVLYNDETHTYDGVIRALTLAINHCSEANAMRLATIVDREGRTIVASGLREHCEAIKSEIEKRTKKDSNQRTQKTGPLLVKVFPSTLSALQLLSIRLLGWLSTQAQEFPPFAVILSESLLFGCPDCDQVPALGRARLGHLEKVCDCALPSHIVYLMVFDRRLWKSARIAFHQLLMSTVLMDLDHKNAFGRLLVRNYNVIFDDFIEDDHEHSVSVTSMTVQIFSVPTVARRLISEENALYVCMEYLRDFCTRRYLAASPHNEHIKQLNFSNDTYPAVLRRALYSLNDIGYLLTQVPRDGSEWTALLREGFVHGAHTFLRFLNCMQTMDEVKRQSTEHQLMESEWETAFNIFLRMQEPLSLLLAWARTDSHVQLNLFLKTMQLMWGHCELRNEFKAKRNRVEVNGHHAFCIPFEVSRNAVSVHQPLWRFLAGLMCASADILRFYTTDDASKFDISAAENANKLVEQVLAGHLRLNISGMRTFLLEMPLRVLVLNAQVSAAQLWRRNGFSLINQVHNYASCLCRTEMFDRDIQTLQVVGATMEPNKFLIRLLDRFGLAKWAAIGFEELSTQPGAIEGTNQEESGKIFSVLAEEIYHLLIILLGERYSVGISIEATPEKALEREIVHILSTGPKPFSHIEKHMPNDPAFQRLPLDTAVRSVSDFKRPVSAASGQFHLKDSLRTQYNAFFWHYSKHLISLAEQQQQKVRSGLSRELKACPPPKPPPFAPFFAPLLRIMESDLFVKLIRVVFERVAKRSRFVSDGLFYRTLFLTGMALNEQESAHLRNESFNFLRMAKAEGIFDFLVRLQDKPEAEAHNDLLWWIMKHYTEVSALYKSEDGPTGVLPDTNVQLGGEDGARKSAQRAAVAAQKRQLALERMRKLQTAFKTKHPDQTENTPTGPQGVRAPKADDGPLGDIDEGEPAVLAPGSGFPVCCGPTKSRVELRPQPSIKCILCQEDECISFDGSEMVCSAFVQNSSLFARQCIPTKHLLSHGQPTNAVDELLNIFAPVDLPQELHVSTCSHLMHFSCYKQFIDSSNARERLRRPNILNSRMLNVEANEYLCPLCKRVSNCALPVFPPPVHSLADVFGFSVDSGNDERSDGISFSDWVFDLRTAISQPIQSAQSSPDKQQSAAKGHSRKRSYSERTLTELAKDASESASNSGDNQQQHQADAGPTTAGVSHSSVSSLPSALESVQLMEIMMAGHQQLQQQQNQSDHSSRTSMNEAIIGQIQAAESNMLSGGRAAIVQQLMSYVFGSKKMSPKDISQTNVPSSVRHWEILQPLLSAFARTAVRKESTHQSASSSQNLARVSPFARLSELLNVLRSCSFVVRSLSAVLEAENKPLFGAFNTRQRDCLNAYVRLAMIMPFNCQPTVLRLLVFRLLSPLLVPPISAEEDTASLSSSTGATTSKTATAITMPSLPQQQQQLPKSPLYSQLEQALRTEVGIMHIDMLTLAVELVMCIGWTWVYGNRVLHSMYEPDTVWKVADGSIDELYAVRLTLLAHIFQIVEMHEPEYESSVAPSVVVPLLAASTDSDDGKASDFMVSMELLRRLFPHHHLWKWTQQSERALYDRIHHAAISFLRPLAILYSAITLVPPPESLKDPSLDSFVPLCRYLGLPSTLPELFTGAQVEQLFQMWSMPHQRFKQNQRDLIALHLPLRVNTLIELPNDYSELVKMTVNFRCPEVKELTSTIPTLCLNCGEMLCSQGYCCQKMVDGHSVGACNAHMSRCQSSSGVFLRIRECQIICLLVTGGGELTRGCFKAAPYVDEFGETDPGFRRGNPMHLNRELYWKMQRLWLHQEIAEEIINQYELNYRNIAFEWNNF
uniref:E3 ubiquitin-protein ligase n=1 Tax=Globodera rostochiensis TaxID=31243 RepID=A0A914H4U2_GLORO